MEKKEDVQKKPLRATPKTTPLALSNLSLKHLVEESQFLVNGFVNKIQSLDNGWMKIKIHTKLGDKNLIITPNAFFVAEAGIPAKQNPGGFSAFLKKYLFNQRLVSLKQHGLDRIAVMEFPEKVLVLEMFAKGNMVLCDREMNILMAMRKEEWKDRKLEKEAQYKFPSSRGLNPLDETEEDFFGKLKESKKTFFGACVDLLNVSPAIMERAFEELGFDKKKNAIEVNERQSTQVLKKLQEVYSASQAEAYLSEGAIYSTETGKEKQRVFGSVNEAVRELMSGEAARAAFDSKDEEKLPPKDPAAGKMKAEKDLESKVRQIAELEIEERALKEKAEKIYLHYSEISEIIAKIKLLQKEGLGDKEIEEKIKKAYPAAAALSFQRNRIKMGF